MQIETIFRRFEIDSSAKFPQTLNETYQLLQNKKLVQVFWKKVADIKFSDYLNFIHMFIVKAIQFQI